MKNILMITTGGTIACVPSNKGLIPQVTGKDILEIMPELNKLCNIDIMPLMNIDSSNITIKDFNKILNTVKENYNKYDGFVITHGTDTMAYTSSYLYNAIENINKHVVITGSQLPLKTDNTDAENNLYAAFLTACSNNPGVYLVFNNTIHQGNTVKKVYSEEFKGFLSINNHEAGYIKDKKIIWNDKTHINNEDVVFHNEYCENIISLKITPSLSPKILEVMVDMGCKGIIIESYGAGGVPTDECENDFIPYVKNAVEKGVIIVSATQCLYNGVHLNKYPMGVLAEKYGVISAKNMTFENTFAKLIIALGKNMNSKEVKEYFDRDNA